MPLASLAKGCAIAQPGETIILRGGVYREVLAPANDGVTVRAIKGEKVTISGADLIEGWKREADGSWCRTQAREQHSPMDDCAAKRPFEGLARGRISLSSGRQRHPPARTRDL
ncbi:MAG: hypothetical protein ABSH34_11585 [Verrucomicrobiota bacterium]